MHKAKVRIQRGYLRQQILPFGYVRLCSLNVRLRLCCACREFGFLFADACRTRADFKRLRKVMEVQNGDWKIALFECARSVVKQKVGRFAGVPWIEVTLNSGVANFWIDKCAGAFACRDVNHIVEIGNDFGSARCLRECIVRIVLPGDKRSQSDQIMLGSRWAIGINLHKGMSERSEAHLREGISAREQS